MTDVFSFINFILITYLHVRQKIINPEFFIRFGAFTDLISVPAQAVFARGIAAVYENYICVGKCWVEFLSFQFLCSQKSTGLQSACLFLIL